MDVNDQECDTALGLGISGHYSGRPSSAAQLDMLPLASVSRDSSSLQILPCANNSSVEGSAKSGHANKLPPATCCSNQYDDTHNNNNNMVSSANSSGSSFHVDSNVIDPEATISIKRKRDGVTEKHFEAEKAYCRVSEEEEEGSGGTRKKLRLSKQQSAFLEESFKQNSTLNPKQKQALAKHLNLLPRQVEVWFQNRRARTKLKQTEVDCEFLKGCYESLTEENKRLQRELLELRSLKLAAASPLYMQFPSPTLTMCPSCERVVTFDNSRAFTSLQKTYFHPSYTQSSSAAC